MIMKKILFVIPSSQIGGVTTSLQSIIDNLNNDDYDIRIFAITHHQGCEITYRNILLPEDKLLSSYWCIYKREPYGRRIQFLGMKILKQLALRFGWPLEDWLFVRAMKRLESNFDFDTIIAFSEGATTKFVSYTTYPKKIAWIHSNYNVSFPDYSFDESTIYNKFDCIVNVSKYTNGCFISRYSSLEKKCAVIYNLLDVKRIIQLSKEEIDDSIFANSKDKFVILSVGRVCQVKQYSKIPEIVSKVLIEHPNIKWYIIGPLDSDPVEVSLLKENIEKYNVKDNVIILGGKKNPYPYFLQANLLVSTSFSEACPMIFNEAKILGLPVVSTEFGSAYEFINDGEDGVITSLDNMPVVISKMINDVEFYKKIKEAIRPECVISNKDIIKQISDLLK